MTQTSDDPGRTVRVACAADDGYVMPLAVTLVSAAANLEPGFDLEVYLLGRQIAPANQRRLVDTLSRARVTVHWIEADFSLLDEFQTSHHVSRVAYYRLLLSRLLPETLTRVLYLDSDLLVLGSLSDIWTLPFDGAACRAVQDIACPFVDCRRHTVPRRARPYLATLCPIPNHRTLGIPGDAPYFNSGVMLIDLAAWRAKHLCQRFVDCLRDNRRHVFCWDQYALNVVLAGDWRPLPAQWNQGTQVYEFPSASHSPVSADDFAAMRDDPKIVHFTTEWKPWQFGNRHPYRDAFFETLDQTGWSGWRPEPRRFSVRRLWRTCAPRLRVAWLRVANAWT